MKRPCLHHPVRSGGFTLLELLVVIAIMAILLGLAMPLFTSLQKANNLNTATATIATLLEQARADAMANNTYVFVGIEETAYATPRTQAQTAGTGRVAIQIFSSLDGTLNLTASNLRAQSRLQIFDNIDLPASITATTGTLSNRQSVAAPYIVDGSGTSFPTAAGTIASGTFTFSKIVAFNPQGTLYVPTSPPTTGLQYIEIDVQQTNGSNVPANATNLSAIQVDGLTGAITIYRS